ncbi:MAG: signal peptidase I [Acidobacteriota bacterium]
MKWHGIIFIAISAVILSIYTDSIHFVPLKYRLASGSMNNTLFVADNILIDLTAYDSRHPEYDEIIVFIFPEDASKWFIKRVIGKPGDTVCIENRQVFVNGQKRAEDYTIHTDTKPQKRRDTMPPTTIPPGTYFVLGDNRDESYDSRFFGPVAREKIIGKARIIIWSDTWSRIGKTL